MASGYVGGLTILGSVASLGLAAYLLGGVSQHAFDAHQVRQHAGIYYMVTATLMTIGILVAVLPDAIPTVVVRRVPRRTTTFAMASVLPPGTMAGPCSC